MNGYLRNLALLIGFSSLTIPSISNAYSIADAIKATRENNLGIKVSRDELKTAKTLKQSAIASFLPQVNATANFNHNILSTPEARQAYGESHDRVFTLQVQQPLFTGGSSLFNLNYAENSINAAQFSLLSTKEQIILKTINAYETLLTTREIYNISVNNEEVINNHLIATQAKLELGEATITDVSQSISRLAAAQSNKITAQGQVTSAEANFTAITGEYPPAKLEPIKSNKISIPANLEQFIEVALRKNSNIKQAKSNAEGTRNQKQLAYSALSPQVSAVANFTRSDRPKNYSNTTDGDTFALNVQIPIFQGGTEYINIKKAKLQERKANHTYDSTVTAIIQQVTQAWSQYHTTKATIESTAKAVTFAQDAFKGVEQEEKFGTRTTLDVLDAQQQVFEAKVENRRAHMDNVVSLFTIHALMSTLNSMDFSEY